MSHKLLFAVETNPNDVTGGGGCVCSPIKQSDCRPPYVVFPGNELDNPQSPHVVVCQACLEAGVAECASAPLTGGEVSPVQSEQTALEWDDEEVPRV